MVLPSGFAGPSRTRRFLRPALIALAVLVGLLAIGAAAAGIWLRSRLVAGLPVLDGEIVVAGLAAPVQVEFDRLGVPTIRGATREDVARATGFLHAQNRFFQMDLLRRQAAGELAEILGPAVVRMDTRIRVHRLRNVARRIVDGSTLPEDDRAILDAYAEGVNTGLLALGAPPFEYLVLREEPAPWRREDSILVILAMFIELNDEDGSRESALGLAHDLLPEPLYAFLAPRGTEWDAPLIGGPFSQPPPPGPEIVDLRAAKTAASVGRSPAGRRAAARAGRPAPTRRADAIDAGARIDAAWSAAGSNNFAVSARRTADGRAILANDMHLPLSVPNTWYRASFVWPDGGGEHRVTGVTLPGVPVIVAGSNGHVAWGYTNSYGDWSDLVVLDTDPADSSRYLTPEGSRAIEHVAETIHVKGADDETLEVQSTIWGPVIDRDHRGRSRAFRWTAYDEEAVNFRLLGMETAGTLEEALDAAARSGIPPQNCLIADDRGRIAWTIMGAIPRRIGFDGRLPSSWADGSRRWEGYLSPGDHPRIVDPESGILWSANARVAEGEMLRLIGDGGYDLGARAAQIRDDLAALDAATEADMLRIQLDDRAVFLERWRGLLLRLLGPEVVASDPRRREMRDLVENWGGRASIDSAGYRLTRAYRSFAHERAFRALTDPCRKADERFTFYEIPQGEGPLWSLVTERPAHLLDPNFPSWSAFLLAVADETIDYYVKDGSALARHTWGERNTVRVAHPISRAIPLLGRWLDMPAEPLPGDLDMPRVQGPNFGASERLAVSPGREVDGYFHMPCGQSGHPMSPHYGDGHAAWTRGERTPFLPGPAEHALTLTPGRP